MPVLSITRSYSDGEVLTAADLTQIKTATEALINTTKLDDDNLQNSGITASRKLLNSSIDSNTLATSSVTTEKMLDDAIITSKFVALTVDNPGFNDDAITSDKVSTTFGRATAGMIINMHTYNDEDKVQRGWMICDGKVIDQTNYDDQHGAGMYVTDDVASSVLDGKYLPDFEDRFALSVAATSETGVGAVSSSGANTYDISHDHDVPLHTHDTNGTPYQSKNITGPAIANEEVNSAAATTSGSSLSATQDMRPQSIRFLFLMRVI